MKTDEIKTGSRVVGCDKAGNPLAGVVSGVTKTDAGTFVDVAPVFYHPARVPIEQLWPAPTVADLKERAERTAPDPMPATPAAEADPGLGSATEEKPQAQG